MSKIHILAGSNSGIYTAVVHIDTPAGNNAVGTTWAAAIVNSGRAKTIMATGNGPGQISSSEAAQVLNGTVIEGTFLWQDDPSMNNAQRVADLSLRASQLTDELLARYAKELNYFGYAGN